MLNAEIAEHYDSYQECYRHWSGDNGAGYHFGVASKIGDIFNNDKMIQNASELIFSSLSLDYSMPMRVLDAGCGAGHVGRLLVRKLFDKDIIVYGVTLSKKQLELGRKLNIKNNMENKIVLSINDFEKLPFKNEFFDAIFFQDSICHGSGKSKSMALKEAARVLKPGGKIAITDGFIFSEKGNFLIKKINKILCRDFSVEQWAEEKEFVFSLKKNRFTNIKIKNLTWLSSPSIFQLLFFKLPKVLISCIRKQLKLKDLKYTLDLTIFAPILGLHPYFKYQLISAKKMGNDA